MRGTLHVKNIIHSQSADLDQAFANSLGPGQESTPNLVRVLDRDAGFFLRAARTG